MGPAVTESTEMYLVTVYRLTQHVTYTSTSDIAATLGVSLPSVSEKVKRLTEEGYVLHEWRQGVALTEEGRRIALNVLRKHRLIATFLVQQAGYGLDEVYEEACRLEHVISDRLANRLEELLGYPEVDPQGNPIPARDGTIALLRYTPLASIAPGTTVVIRHIGVLDQERFRYVCELGIIPDTVVRVLDVAPFNGPLTLAVETRTVALDRGIAHDIGVNIEEEVD
ncbi:MAG: metal-dependent transcriptional regulator [Chloroflexales bacterium]|nr:metal-dependent transcriptional regulator [Chloroflexales bacterium]